MTKFEYVLNLVIVIVTLHGKRIQFFDTLVFGRTMWYSSVLALFSHYAGDVARTFAPYVSRFVPYASFFLFALLLMVQFGDFPLFGYMCVSPVPQGHSSGA